MLLRAAVLDRIAAGEVDLAFRSWRRPTVRAGGTLRTAVGVLAIGAVEPISPDDISDGDARRAGHDGRAALLADLERAPSRGAGDSGRTIYRIELRLAGEDPREARRLHTDLGDGEREQLDAALDRMDASRDAPGWARAALALIADRPSSPPCSARSARRSSGGSDD
ncbi:MAG: hypothetical protein S0880_04885 [Actinomycetota bacterium]|nr:hypothetical protein [Actinomycetota bacterium]